MGPPHLRIAIDVDLMRHPDRLIFAVPSLIVMEEVVVMVGDHDDDLPRGCSPECPKRLCLW